jgi:hypothetical protein
MCSNNSSDLLYQNHPLFSTDLFYQNKTNQRSEYRGNCDKTNKRSEHRGDSEKTNVKIHEYGTGYD